MVLFGREKRPSRCVCVTSVANRPRGCTGTQRVGVGAPGKASSVRKGAASGAHRRLEAHQVAGRARHWQTGPRRHPDLMAKPVFASLYLGKQGEAAPGGAGWRRARSSTGPGGRGVLAGSGVQSVERGEPLPASAISRRPGQASSATAGRVPAQVGRPEPRARVPPPTYQMEVGRPEPRARVYSTANRCVQVAIAHKERRARDPQRPTERVPCASGVP